VTNKSLSELKFTSFIMEKSNLKYDQRKELRAAKGAAKEQKNKTKKPSKKSWGSKSKFARKRK